MRREREAASAPLALRDAAFPSIVDSAARAILYGASASCLTADGDVIVGATFAAVLVQVLKPRRPVPFLLHLVLVPATLLLSTLIVIVSGLGALPLFLIVLATLPSWFMHIAGTLLVRRQHIQFGTRSAAGNLVRSAFESMFYLSCAIPVAIAFQHSIVHLCFGLMLVLVALFMVARTAIVFHNNRQVLRKLMDHPRWKVESAGPHYRVVPRFRVDDSAYRGPALVEEVSPQALPDDAWVVSRHRTPLALPESGA